MRRRHFLRYSSAGVVIPGLLSGFGVKALGVSPWAALLNSAAVETDHVLVLIRLDGGNDGLNTVIPLDQYDRLANVRPQVILPYDQLLPLDGQPSLGFHPAMEGLRDLFNQGKLKIIQSVGYPNQDFSHFRSTDIWMTGSDADEVLSSGWAGRYLHQEFPNFPADFPNEDMPDPLSLEIGASLSLTLQGPLAAMGMSVSDPTAFYQLVNGISTPAPPTPAGDLLTYVRTIKRQSNAYGQIIVDAYEQSTNLATYPGDNELAEQLRIVARLIAGGLKTRIYLVSISGFDTHDSQVVPGNTTQGEHAGLLRRVSEAISAFQQDIGMLGVAPRVTGMTFSEFGRRVISNFSNGTDHGAAAPLFVFGQAVSGGVVGDNPVIPGNANEDDNLPMQYDFRSVYATILQDWFCVPEPELRDILFQDFQTLPIFEATNCAPTAVREQHQRAGAQLIDAYPNPFTERTTIRFRSMGERTLVQVFNGAGQLVATPALGPFAPGEHQLDWEAGPLPAGHYYIRLQQGAAQQVRMVQKIR